MIWSSDSLSKALEIKTNLFGNRVKFFSKDVTRGDIFIALSIGASPGSNYVMEAFAKGANFCIVEKRYDKKEFPREKIILVDDSYEILKKLALYKRKQSKATFISITGSCGKTTTKDMISHIFEHQDKTFASYKNFNNELGTIINLASIEEGLKYAIFELGTNNKGEIENLTNFTKHHIALITNIGTAHIGKFGKIDAIFEEKSKIFCNMPPSGKVILNADSKFFSKLSKIAKSKNLKIISFGFSQKSDLNIVSTKTLKTQTKVYMKIANKNFNFDIPLYGDHQVYNVVSSLACAYAVNLNLDKCIENIGSFTIGKGRGKILNIKLQNKQFTVLDKSYNASTTSIKATLDEALKMQGFKRKVLILGHMLETEDENSNHYHLSLKPDIVRCKIDKVIVIGNLAKNLFESLDKNMQTIYLDNYKSYEEKILSIIADKDLVIIQGSNRLKLSELLDYFSTKI